MTEPDNTHPEWDGDANDLDEGTADVYPFLQEFVERHLAPLLARPSARCWCACWWAHPEAVDRLRALWRAWEVLQRDDVGLSSWWVYHLDPHLRVLFDQSGPFAACRDGHTEKLQPLPTVPVPPERTTSCL
jgi:hypothetical protein